MFCPTTQPPAHFAKHVSPRAILSFLLALSPVLAAPLATAQSVNVSPNPASYPTLKAAFDAINNGTHTGAVVVEVVANTTESQSVQLNASGVGAASYTSLLVRPQGARIVSGDAGANNPLIRLVGADQVTIDGLRSGGNSLRIEHTQTAAASTIVLSDGASNNRLTRFEMLGAGGAVLQVLTDAATGQGNDHNVFEDLDIGASAAGIPRFGIQCVGSTSSANAANQFNQLTGSRLRDAFHPTLDAALISLGDGCNSWTLNNNRLYQTAPRTFASAATFRAIEINATNGLTGAQGYLVTDNVIGAADAAGNGTMVFDGTGGKFRGIVVNALSTGLLNTFERNTIANIAITTDAPGTASAAVFTGIQITRGPSRIVDNRIGDMATTASIAVQNSATTASEILGINGLSDDQLLISANQVGGLRYQGTGAANSNGFQVIGIVLNPPNRPTHYVVNNRVGGDVADSMSVLGASSQVAVTGILSVNADSVISANNVQNLTALGGIGSGNVVSVNGIVANNNATMVHVIGNRVSKLRNTDPAADTRVRGITVNGNLGSVIADNVVDRLDAASTHASAAITGIHISAANAITRNNMVALGADIDGNPISASRSFTGISEAGFNTHVLHNSVLIFGSNVQGNKVTIAFNGTQASATRQYFGNIFSNQRTNGSGTASHMAIRLTNTVTNTGFLSNWNNFHVATAGAVLAEVGTTSVTTLSAWQSATNQDAASVSVDPAFLSSADLHLSPASPVRGLAPANARVTRDLDQTLRPIAGPFDLGADEVAGAALPASNAAILAVDEPQTPGFRGVSTSFVPRVRIENQGTSTLNDVPVTMWIRDASNALVYEQTVVIASLSPGAIAKLDFASTNIGSAGAYTWQATVAAVGDLVAADNTQNGTLTIAGPMSGVYTVGTSGDFSSLTNPGGAFQVLSALSATSPVELRIISDLNAETGTYPLRQLGVGSSVLIRSFGAPRTIRGAALQALIRIDAVDNVTIDGSTALATSPEQLGGTAGLRELTVINDAPGFGAVIQVHRSASGADNVVIRNLVTTGQSNRNTQWGILAGAEVLGGGALNTGLRIENCEFRRTAVGIGVFGGGLGAYTGTVITRNDLGISGADALGRIGVEMQTTTNSEISLNRVGGINTEQVARVIGLALGSDGMTTTSRFDNAQVSRNQVSGLTSSPSGLAVVGLALGNASNVVLSNNVISNLLGRGRASEFLIGLNIVQNATSNVSVWHNSVHLSGDRGGVPTSMTPSYALRVDTTNPVLNLKNNIFANTMTTSAPNAFSRVFGYSASAFGSLDADANLYWSAGPNAQFAVRNAFGTQIANLAAWRTTTGDELVSLFDAPLFVADDNLHLQTSPLASPAISAALDLPSIAIDIDGDSRAATERDIGADEVVTPPQPALVLSASQIEFGAVNIGASSAVQTITLSNPTSQGLRITALTDSQAPFVRDASSTCAIALPLIIPGDSSCSLAYRFNPATEGLAQQTIAITHAGTGDQQFALRGTGVLSPAQLQVSASQITFDPTRVGTISSTRTLTLSNSGQQVLNVATLSPITAPFVASGGTCASAPFALTGGQGCTLILAFAPTVRGPASEIVHIDAGAGGSSAVNLQGTGIQGVLQQTPSQMAFGAINVGSVSAAQTLTLSNTGDADLAISTLAGLVAPFELVPGGSCPATLPIVLAANASCTIDLRFAPLAGGAFEATLLPTSDGLPSSGTVLNGSGLMPDALFRSGFEDVVVKRLSPEAMLGVVASLPFEQWPLDQAIEISTDHALSAYPTHTWARRTLDARGSWKLQWATTMQGPSGRWSQTAWQSVLPDAPY